MTASRIRSFFLAALCAFGTLFAAGANAGLIGHYVHSYLAGGLTIVLDLYDGQPGGRYLWQYTVTNVSYDPNPGTSNGFSGFELFLPTPIPEIADLTAPPPGIAIPGWEVNCCSGQPVEWDIRNSDGDGVMPGESGVFSFTTDPRAVAINDNGWFHTWQDNVQTDIIPTLGMHVPWVPGLTPIPEPTAISLLAIALAALGATARRRAKG